MKRKLTDEEFKLTNFGIKKREKEIVDLDESIMVNEKHLIFTKAQRDYEDSLRPYNRKIEDKNFKLKLATFNEQLTLSKMDLKNLKSQLRNGVEVKQPTNPIGVN